MILLYLTIVCFMLYVVGPFSASVELLLLAVGFVAGWFAFLEIDFL